MKLDSWHQIREWHGAKWAGFEELVCQLAHTEPAPAGARFNRKGTPDAGLECFWMLPSGEEWGWLTKFFPDHFASAQWKQCDKSVRAALEHHPKLTRLVLSFPCSFPDARLPRQRSALQRWEDHRAEWSKWAAERGMAVDFVLWDEHQLLRRLSRPEHQGRILFWFGLPAMDAVWFQRHVATTIALAAERYTPDLHFELPLARRFEALGRTPAFWAEVNAIGGNISAATANLEKSCTGKNATETPRKIRDALHRVLAAVNDLPRDATQLLDFTNLRQVAQAAAALVDDALHQLWSARRERARQFQARHGRPPECYDALGEEFSSHCLNEISSRLNEVVDFCGSEGAMLAHNPRMLLVGEAGLGKTHLVCSAAEKRSAAGLPTILLLGQQFDESEPWSQILQLLGLSCSRDEFLGALDAAGEAAGCRALIIIDALNEGVGMRFWKRHLASFLTQTHQYPHVGVALTVRDAYALPGSFPDDLLIRVEHHGFAGQADAASRHFFRHYGLAEPNVPVLSLEFENPLLLKLLCTAIKDSGQHEIPADLIGVTAIFGFVLDKINARLAELLDYLPGEDRVHRAVLRLAELMADGGSDYVSLEVAKRELDSIHPNVGYSQSLLCHLIAEHLIQRVPAPDSAGTDQEAVRFTYQRLSDHLIVQSLLVRTPRSRLRQVFGPKGIWGWGLTPGWVATEIVGLIEALAIQLPETHGLEIDQVLPGSIDQDVVRHAFISSLIWRRPRAFSAATRQRLKKLTSGAEGALNGLLEAVVSITARPDHPCNADWLDGWLRPLAMAERDAFWSKFLFGKMREENSVQRLIEWAWAERQESRFPDEVVRLASLTLAWFLTTSDRFVRDRATKALVALLKDRIPVLVWLLEHFADSDEPYVQERLYAVAYGCAMHTRQTADLHQLAQSVYNRIFRRGSPAPSVLLRDHARGVVEVAVRRGVQLDYDPERIKPPFRSKWPKAPPSLSRLHARFKGEDEYEKDWALSRIFESVTADDFKHYVIGDVTIWSNHRKRKSHPSPRELFQILPKTMPQEAEHLKFYEKLCRELADSSSAQSEIWRQEQRKTISQFESYFTLALGRNKARQFLRHVAPYLKASREERYKRVFDLELFQRLILRRVLELGWTSERFGEFDRKVPSEGRKDHKAERIGKKYQWIAYDEFHARISDNFGPSDDGLRLDEGEWERGTWSDRFRDIDPSLLVSKTGHDGWGTNQRNWWTPCIYDGWPSAPTPLDWLKASADLPPPASFLELTGPDKAKWMMLYNYTNWKRKERAGEFSGEERDSHEVHYIFRSYLVRREHLRALVGWGKRQNWINDLLPSPDHWFHRHLHEHYWSPHFDSPVDDEWINKGSFRADLPHPVVETTSEYLCEDSNIDCSMDSDVLISLPSRWLAQKMGLHLSGRRGEFVDANGSLAAFDPSTRDPGHSALVMRRDALSSFITRERLALVWTLLGEKNIYPPRDDHSWLGRLTILGMYHWEGAQIEGNFRTEFIEGHN